MESRIPIQNIYYLLVYAWDRLAEGKLVDVSGIESTELVDLYAKVLLGGMRHLLRRGLDQTYLPIEAEIAGVRGRVQMTPTMRRMLVQHGRAQCQFDELTVDTLPNRILLATLRRLVRTPELDKGLRESLCELNHSLRGIRDIPLTKQLFRTVQLHGNNGFYKFLLSLCELVLDSSLSTEDAGSQRFRDFARDAGCMAQLFESFVFNFYRRECPHIEVKSERIYWTASSVDDPDLTFLPTMQTDISLRTPGRTLIIDTKFYQDTFQRNYGGETARSGHLYQLFSYLKNLEARGGQDASAEGMLLYPVVSRKLRLQYEASGHAIRVCTVDLAQKWTAIRDELLALLNTQNA